MKNLRVLSIVAFVAMAAVALSAIDFAHAGYGKKKMAIYPTAKKAGFATLTAAIEAAGLEEVLTKDGPFTVFAPTDDAFAKLPEGTVEALLEDKEALKNILLYHVVSGKVKSSDVVKLSSAEMLNGQSVKIKTGKHVMVNGARVIDTDIMAENGIIHVIDSVLLPPDNDDQASAKGANILETAREAGFNTLIAAVEAAGLEDALNSDGPFTVFAPTDDAFAKLPDGTVEALLNDAEALKAILLYHVVSGEVMSSDVVKLSSAKTLNGEKVEIGSHQGVKINDAKVIKADVKTSNGVIHVIDTVLIPSGGKG